MSDAGIVFFGTAVGFAFAGLIASAYHVVSGRPLSFALLPGSSPAAAFLGIFLRMAAGPFLLARSAVLAFESEDGGREAWVLFAVVLACVWGFLSGVIVIETVASLGTPGGTSAWTAKSALLRN